LGNLIKQEFSVLENSALQKNISLISGFTENIILVADENMLSTTLRNLFSNAIKFTPNNGKVTVMAKVEDGQVEISVSDTGIGMEAQTIQRLFNIETSFTTRGTQNEKGTGLGLLLCKEFIEKHGGKITVKSEPGVGSTFQFILPKNRDL
jgi:signal transduction histidine kinase